MPIKKLDKLLFSLLGVLCIFSVARMINNSDYLIIDILSHFCFQYAIAALLLLLIFLRKKLISLVVLTGFLLFFNLTALSDYGETVQASGHAGSTFRVYSANLHIKNHDLSKLNYELEKMDPEMVLLLEVTPEHLNQIQTIRQNYPYSIEKQFIGESEIGFIFLSKFPILDNNIARLSDVCNFVLEAKVNINQTYAMFYGVHAQRPGIQNVSERKKQFLQLARLLKEQTFPVIVAGDFNTTPFSPIFRELLNISDLKDSRSGFGWQPSWPTYFPLLLIPIDHILLSPGIQVHNRATGSYMGSDHYPVYADISL